MMNKGMIRVLFFALFVCGMATMYAQGSWEVVDVPTQQHLRSVYFTDSLYGWAVGDSGTIIHTTDGGEGWEVQDAGTDNHIVHVFFLNRQLGWASSWNYTGSFGTIILKTTNGGETWVGEAYQEDNIFMNCILYLDSLTGWMGGSPHALVRTTDGGQSWTQAAIDTNALAFFPVLNVYFYDENHGYACGGMFDIAGVTWSTSNGGEMWYPIDTEEAPADEVHGMHLFGPLNVLGAGGDPDQGYGVAMIRTNNGGTNWEYEELSMQGNAFDIDFRNDSEAWAPLGPQQKLIYSLDTGNSWTEITCPENTSIFDMTFTDTVHGYGVGYHGAFIKYKPKWVGLREQDEVDIEMSIFPNPAHQQIVIQFDLGSGYGERWSGGELSIVDTYGRSVKLLAVSHISAGKNTIRMDVSTLPPGIYVCRLELQNSRNYFASSQKLILRE